MAAIQRSSGWKDRKGVPVNIHINEKHHRTILQSIARRVMIERGLWPDFSDEALAEIKRIQMSINKPARDDSNVRDMRNLPWASIDNDDSLDLDQLTVAQTMPDGKVRIMVAIADVDALVHNGTALDNHARHNTTSVYTAARIFPMLPDLLSTNLTSLNLNEGRLALVVAMELGADGSLLDSSMYRALVCNHAKLAYNNIAPWLEGSGIVPEAVSSVIGLAENLLLQDKAAQNLKKLRHANGALTLETVESKPVFDGDQIRTLEIEEKNRAKELIEDFMIAANGVTARYLAANDFPSIRRVVRTPKRWERIIEIAWDQHYELPSEPDSKALEDFLVQAKAVDPIRFPDLSLAVIKLLGSGEYVAESSDETAPGHFGLAVKDYAHSTAPNRRYPDLLTQRLLKAALEGKPCPYSKDELDELAAHCTEAEDAATKVERRVEKSAAALMLESSLGETFESIVTGASEKGTWVRLLTIPVEGKLEEGFEGLDVGDQIRVQLILVDVQKGFIDFRKINSSRKI
ncbi:MAG: RNB domain-containing ribonuclease [Anaerolineales bacterium]|nr:RNB domain-containing ribonuclease [Anaerolineales bacterium]